MFKPTEQIHLFKSMLSQTRHIIPRRLAHTSTLPLFPRTAINSIHFSTLTMALGLTGLAVSSYTCNARLVEMSRMFDERMTAFETKLERNFERMGKSMDELHDQLKDMNRRLGNVNTHLEGCIGM